MRAKMWLGPTGSLVYEIHSRLICPKVGHVDNAIKSEKMILICDWMIRIAIGLDEVGNAIKD
jgi:hypothetical protein